MAKKALLVGINKKGYIKLKTLPRNRIKYIITPKGLAEKARLTPLIKGDLNFSPFVRGD